MSREGWRAPREGWGRGLVDLGEAHEDVVVIVSDNINSLNTNLFQEKFPERMIEVGIMEQNMVNIAAGMSRCLLYTSPSPRD